MKNRIFIISMMIAVASVSAHAQNLDRHLAAFGKEAQTAKDGVGNLADSKAPAISEAAPAIRTPIPDEDIKEFLKNADALTRGKNKLIEDTVMRDDVLQRLSPKQLTIIIEALNLGDDKHYYQYPVKSRLIAAYFRTHVEKDTPRNAVKFAKLFVFLPDINELIEHYFYRAMDRLTQADADYLISNLEVYQTTCGRPTDHITFHDTCNVDFQSREGGSQTKARMLAAWAKFKGCQPLCSGN